MRNMIRDKWNSECYKFLSINIIFLVAKTVRLVMSVAALGENQVNEYNLGKKDI